MFRRWLRWLRGNKRPKASLNTHSPEAFAQHAEEFRQEIITVTEGVHVAIGFGLANSIMLEGEDSVAIVDTLGSVEAAEVALKAFRQKTDKPVSAIVYTHNHTDHIFGAGVFAEGGNPNVYAHASTSGYIDKIASVIRPVITRRSMRQFGPFLNEGDHIHSGIGLFLETGPDSHLALMRPTHTFEDRWRGHLAGIKVEMVHAPGETNDQIVLWLPDKKLLIAADNFYRSFPNLYAIRGTAHRDLMQWVRSLDLMRTFPADIMVPCHTRPLFGRDNIQNALRDYRDAIQYVHDQTVRWMNKGLTPDEIVEHVHLPEHLATSPYLQEFYGTVAWSVRSVFAGYLGWFSGNATDLNPLPRSERAQRTMALAGGEANLRKQTKAAVEQEDHAWALELTDHGLQMFPNDREFVDLRIQALQGMAATQTSANGRNYYLTQAYELKGLEIPLNRETPLNIVHSIPLSTIFAAMATNLNAEKSRDVDQKLNFHFPDTNEDFSLHIRRGVAEVRDIPVSDPDFTVTVESTVWKEVVADIRNPVKTFAGGDIKIEGGAMKLAQLLLLFDKPS
ncbi:MAG: MBL fold metallo-hydrolase [Deltaproteobacteria bacterium]|nr:MAG: MBL fold metallo-hydrolase [Deltaproteobacteria bacterium]